MLKRGQGVGAFLQELGRSKDRVERLVAKARGDPLAIKVLRNLSQHGGPAVHALFSPYIPDLITSVMVRFKTLTVTPKHLSPLNGSV